MSETRPFVRAGITASDSTAVISGPGESPGSDDNVGDQCDFISTKEKMDDLWEKRMNRDSAAPEYYGKSSGEANQMGDLVEPGRRLISKEADSTGLSVNSSGREDSSLKKLQHHGKLIFSNPSKQSVACSTMVSPAQMPVPLKHMYNANILRDRFHHFRP